MQLPREFIGSLPLRPLRTHPPRSEGRTARSHRSRWEAPSTFSPLPPVCVHVPLLLFLKEVLGLCNHPTAHAHTNCSYPKLYINLSILKLPKKALGRPQCASPLKIYIIRESKGSCVHGRRRDQSSTEASIHSLSLLMSVPYIRWQVHLGFLAGL